jgi:hypothetical protein
MPLVSQALLAQGDAEEDAVSAEAVEVAANANRGAVSKDAGDR